MFTMSAYPSKKSFILCDYGDSSPVEVSYSWAEGRSNDLHVVGVPKERSEPASLTKSWRAGGIGNLKTNYHTSIIILLLLLQ